MALTWLEVDSTEKAHSETVTGSAGILVAIDEFEAGGGAVEVSSASSQKARFERRERWAPLLPARR